MRLTNAGNRFVYRLWSPVYDRAMGRVFDAGRRRALALLDLQPGEHVILVGVGTGVDLPLLPEGVSALGVDLSPAMLARATARLPLPGREVVLQQGDAQSLAAEDRTFDAAILSLILCVVPDARACLRETLRVLKPGGRLVVFDKFLPDAASPSWGRRLGNAFTTLAGTDITRRLGDIVRDQPVRVVRNEPSALGGMFRVVLLESSTAE